jgi:hypothetical protein
MEILTNNEHIKKNNYIYWDTIIFLICYRWYIMIVKIENSLVWVSQKNTIDWLNIYFGRISHHQ